MISWVVFNWWKLRNVKSKVLFYGLVHQDGLTPDDPSALKIYSVGWMNESDEKPALLTP